MATFNPVNYRDFRSRVEQYDEATGRFEFKQLASYARIARHPLARSPMRRQLCPDDFKPAGNGLFTIGDRPALALLDAIITEQNYTYACANGLSKQDVLRGVAIPQRVPSEALIHLQITPPPLFDLGLMVDNILKLPATRKRLNDRYTAAQDRLARLQIWNERAKYLARKAINIGDPSPWTIEDERDMEDITYQDTSRCLIPREYDHQFDDMLREDVIAMGPLPRTPTASYIQYPEETYLALRHSTPRSYTFGPHHLRDLVISDRMSPLPVPVILLPGLLAPSLRDLFKAFMPAVRSPSVPAGPSAPSCSHRAHRAEHTEHTVAIIAHSPIDLTQDADSDSDSDSITYVQPANYIMDLTD